MATPRYSPPAESASASRVSLASAGAGSNAGTVRAGRASTLDGRDGLTRNPYDISTVLAEPQASSSLLPALPTLPSASSYLPSQLSSLSTTFTSAGTLPRSATPGGKSVAQRRSQAPPIQVTELRKVQRTEFDAYLKEIGGEFERWQKESRLGRDGEVDLGDEGSVDERHEDGVGLGIGSDAENSRTPRILPSPRPKKAEEVLPSLDEVPQIFFDSSFTLSNPRTFELVTERIQLSPHPSPDPSKPPPQLASADSTPTLSASSAFDSVPGLGPHTLNDLAADQVLQEKLSHYTAVIESHLVREIGLRSSSFFAALSNLQSLHQQGEDALSKIAELQTALSATEGGVGGTAKHGLQILRAQARRRGLERIEESVRAVEEVWSAVEGVKELVEHGEWDGALDVSEQIEDAYYSSASTSTSDKTASTSALTTRNGAKASNRRPLNLTKLRALSSLPSKLSLLRAQIAKSLEGELTTVLEHEMDVAIDEHVKLAKEGKRWKGKQKAVESASEANGRALENVPEEDGEEADGTGRQDSPEAGARERTVERVRPVMRALIRSDGMDSAVTAWRESVLREIRALVREHLPTAETPTAEEEDHLSLAKKLRALPHPAFLALARETYRGLLACIEVVDLQARILLELWQFGRQEEQQRRFKRRKAHADAPTSESAPPASPTTLQVPGAEADAVQTSASTANDASSVTTDDASSLSTEISDVVHAVAELANVRFSKVIGVRTEVHAQLPLADFVEIFDRTWQFVVDCETVCQRMIVGLRGAMVSQAKTFLQTFHQRQITDNARVVEEEQWAAAEVPARVQKEIAVIVDSAVRDPVQLLLRRQPDATNGTATVDDSSEQAREGDEGEASASGPAKQVDIEGRQFFAVSAGLTTIGVLVEYLKVLLNCPMLTTDAMSKIIEFMKVFNSRTCQVVLGAGAMRSAGLKNITAKHLALASQALSIMIALIPYIRECVRRHLNPKQAVMLTEFDKLKRDYQEHQYEIHAKLVAIMSDRLEVHSRTLSGINWEEPAPKADAPNAYMEGLVKEHITLHKVLSRFLQPETVQQIMSQVFKALDLRLGELYGRVDLRSQQAKDRMLLDVRYLREKLGDLGGLEGQGPAKDLEALVNAKALPKPPPSAPKPSLPPRTSSMAPAAASVPVLAPSDATDSPASSTPHLPYASVSASASAASLSLPDTRSPRTSLDGTATPASSVPNPPSPAPLPAVLPPSPKPATPAPYVSKKKKSLAERLAESMGRKATPSPPAPALDASAATTPAAPRQSSESVASDARPSSDSHDAPPEPQRTSAESDIGVDTPSIERQLELENVEIPLATPAKEELEDVVKAVEEELKEEKPEEVAEGTVKEIKPDEAKLEEAEPEEAEAEGAGSTSDAEASTDSIATPEPVEVEPAPEESAVAVQEVVEATAPPASPRPVTLELVDTGSSASPNTSPDQPDVPTGGTVEEAPLLPAPSAPEPSADGNEEAGDQEVALSPQGVNVSADPSEAHGAAPEAPEVAPAATNAVDEPAPAESLASHADKTLSPPPPTIAEPSVPSFDKAQPEQAAAEAISSNEPFAVSQTPADTPTVSAVVIAPQALSSDSPVPPITTPPPVPTPTKKKSLKERLEEAARRRSSTGSLVDVTSPPASIKSPPPTQQSFPPTLTNGSSEGKENGVQREESTAKQDPGTAADGANTEEVKASSQPAAQEGAENGAAVDVKTEEEGSFL
ncbi:Vacuolar protein sorting-associated protein 54 [Rhodotorula toruloides]|nr:Vacuolar protein sorting-associated protein 54 [Rhodotorula toruloides]